MESQSLLNRLLNLNTHIIMRKLPHPVLKPPHLVLPLRLLRCIDPVTRSAVHV
jgi:hypothetical protein